MLLFYNVTYNLKCFPPIRHLHHKQLSTTSSRMQLQVLSILATLPAVIQAAPILEARKSVNDCGDSTFVNQSSGGSPQISDCQQIARNIAGT
jgi:hypothetical protein